MIQNFDNFWWELKSKDANTEIITTDRIISASITESMGEMDQCTISMLDPNCIYSRIFRNGASFKFGWGSLIDKRSPIEFLVNSPSGGADSKGQITFNMRGQAIGDTGVNRTYYSMGTKGSIVRTVLLRMGVVDAEVDFERMTEVVNNDNKVAQYESDFRFLVRMAEEWRCVFKIGTTKAGTKCAVFCEPAKLKLKMFYRKIAYDALHLEYGGGIANVESYNWQDNSLDASQGASVQVRYINGQPQFFRYIAKDETVITYRLNEEAIQQEYDSQDGFANKIAFTKDVLSAKSFKEVERFFIQDTVSTAPQGSGISVKAHVFGNINITAGQVVTFGAGFPDRIGAKDRTWWVKSVTHSMGINGYFCDVEIQDAYMFSPTGERL